MKEARSFQSPELLTLEEAEALGSAFLQEQGHGLVLERTGPDLLRPATTS